MTATRFGSSEAPGTPLDASAVIDRYVETCTKLYAGDIKGAIASVTPTMASFGEGSSAEGHEQFLVEMCDSMQQLRDDCKAGDARPDPASAEDDREMCGVYQAIFDRLPVHPYKRRPATIDAPAGSAP